MSTQPAVPSLPQPPERDQVIGFLFASCDQKKAQVEDLTKKLVAANQQIAELQKQLTEKA